MPVTQTDIANMALDLLTEGQIDSLDEDTRAARLLSRWWDVVLERELEDNTWIFAIKTAVVEGTQTASDDSNAYNWEYERPPDLVRMLPLTEDGEPLSLPSDWRLEADVIRSRSSSPQTIRYIALLVDPNDWPASFTEVFAASLARKIGHALTGKVNMTQLMDQIYEKALAAARRVNAIQRGSELYRESWSVARGDWRFARP
jgi:hypothetical protein